MITIRYPMALQTQDLDEKLYTLMENEGFEMYEVFEQDYMVDGSTDVVAQFEGDYADFEAAIDLQQKLKELCPCAFSDEADR